MTPRSIFSRWLRHRRNVDFPPPDGPRITTTSPRATSRLTPLRTSSRWKLLQTSTAWTIYLTPAAAPPPPLAVLGPLVATDVPSAGSKSGEHPGREARPDGDVLSLAEALLDLLLEHGQAGGDEQVPHRGHQESLENAEVGRV